MKNLFPKALVLTVVLLVGFMIFDPQKPTDAEVRETLPKALYLSDECLVEDIHLHSSFMGSRALETTSHRVWPVEATLRDRGKDVPEHHFYMWRDDRGNWTAEADDPDHPQWDQRGFYGLKKFGM